MQKLLLTLYDLPNALYSQQRHFFLLEIINADQVLPMRFTRLLQLQLICYESIGPQDNHPSPETEKACGSFKAGYSIQELTEQNALELPGRNH